jgi:hypothetical protein
MNTDEYASQEETVAAIRALSGADHKKLILISRYWYRWRGEPFQGITSPEDLLQEAFVRTLDRKRRWRKSKVGLVRHPDQTMRSISGHLVAKAEDEREGLAAFPGRRAPKLEEQVLARERIAAIEKAFSDDPIALDVLQCRAAGDTASEIRSELSLNDTEYATICKRIVRKFAKTSNRLIEG